MFTAALLMTLLMGIFIPIGGIIGYFIKNNEKILHFLISIATGVIIPLVIIEIMPEVFESFQTQFSYNLTIVYTVFFFLLGMVILKLLDFFVPDHSHRCEEEHCNKEYYHIGIMSFLAIFLHDFIEGMAVYAGTTTSVAIGLSLVIGVGFHNLPLGALISSTIHNSKDGFKKTIIFISILAITPFMGGLLVYFNSDFFLSEMVLSSLLAVTSGMLSYIAIFELIPEIKSNLRNLFGITLGVVLMFISMLI